VAGEEEARAKAVLAEMQLRISQGPESALGLGDAFSPEDVRARFLSLTKQFHPARFGRMSSDLQRLSNEVFLGIKSAHETLLKVLGVPARNAGAARATGGMQPIAPEGTARTTSLRPTGAMPRLSSTGTTPPATMFARGTDRSSPTTRTTTPSTGVKISGQSGSIPRAGDSGPMPGQSGSIPRPMPGASGRTPTPGGTPPLARQGTPAPGQTSPIARPGTLPPGQTSPIARPPTGQTPPTTTRPPTLQPGQTSPLARQQGVRPPTLQPGQTSPLAPRAPGQPQGQGARPPTLQPGQTSPIARPGTLPPGQTSPIARQGTPAPGQTSPIARQGTPAPGQTSPIARQGTPAPGQTSPIARQGTPAPGQTSPIARGGVPGSAQNFNPPTQRGLANSASTARPDPSRPPAPSSTNFNIATQRGVAPQQTQPLQRASAAFDETASLDEAVAFMEQRNWTAARVSLHALAAKVPQSKQYRALLCYSRGREAHAAGRTDEALLEYQRALQLDPDLAQVKQAVAELQRRR
jgi:hypothetical protein